MECLITKNRSVLQLTPNLIRVVSSVKFRAISSASTRQHDEGKSKDNGENLYSSKKQTHFGFNTVSEKQKSKKVITVFENVADRYDLMNDCMSVGVHRIWKDMFVHRLRPKPNTKLIDMAGGTGDIAFRFLKYRTIRPVSLKTPTFFPQQEFPTASKVPSSEVEAQYQVLEQAESDKTSIRESGSTYNTNEQPVLRSVLCCDINAKMLEVGKTRSDSLLTPTERSRISWLETDAENMSAVPSDTYDVYTIAFGIRNCVHIDRVLAEAYRVLRPGGKFMCLEFSHVPNSLLKMGLRPILISNNSCDGSSHSWGLGLVSILSREYKKISRPGNI